MNWLRMGALTVLVGFFLSAGCTEAPVTPEPPVDATGEPTVPPAVPTTTSTPGQSPTPTVILELTARPTADSTPTPITTPPTAAVTPLGGVDLPGTGFYYVVLNTMNVRSVALDGLPIGTIFQGETVVIVYPAFERTVPDSTYTGPWCWLEYAIGEEFMACSEEYLAPLPPFDGGGD